jgi:putative FmdB family regulatory protein
MPIYEYECRNCSCRFELRRKFGEDGMARCPRCLDEARRVFSPVPIFFKGPGFYVTDSASPNRRQADSKRSGDGPADMNKDIGTTKNGKGGVAS